MFRIAVGCVLLVAVAACSGERQAAGTGTGSGTGSKGDDIDAPVEAVPPAPVPDPNEASPVAASQDDEAGDAGDGAAEPVVRAAPEPVELDLRLPQPGPDADDSLFPLTPEPRLPDMFQQNERQRRTTFSGELILGDDEEAGFNLDRIQGGAVEVEVSID